MESTILTTPGELDSWVGDYRSAPVVLRMVGLERTPTEVFLACKKISHHCFILESMEDSGDTGRYTFVGYNPRLELTCHDHVLTIRELGAEPSTRRVDSPGPIISQLIAEHLGPRIEGLPPFTGGLAGYIAYDYLRYGEPSLRWDALDEEGFNDVDLMFFDHVIAFDHLRGEVFCIRTISLDDLPGGYTQALDDLTAMAELVAYGEMASMEELRVGEFESSHTHDEFIDMVTTASHHITEGDIFQVVLSQRVKAEAQGSLFGTYDYLRQHNPSPYMFYFSSDELEIAGASPETLVKLTGDQVMTYPLAGTRPRGRDANEDELLERELAGDEKEIAEHTMLVDLGRNDLGKISEFSSVEVRQLMSVLRFSHVMHLGSVVTGRIREDVTPMDVLGAVLPAGTLSGAPKIRACQIINDLEQVRRGVYGGAIGYLSTTGDLDTCIAIRLAYKRGGRVYLRAGCGIVADSDPEKEWQEIVNKMQAVVDAVSLPHGDDLVCTRQGTP
ncbi:MAG: anthranilate synthase component I family protein [Propionibacteriaceae bacterium]|nr:anthranilate synthase component I family protein [Propionibacteriaceae bacterium]